MSDSKFIRTGIEPVCPHCSHIMVKAFIEDETDLMFMACWLCACEKEEFDKDVEHGYVGTIVVNHSDRMTTDGHQVDNIFGE